MPPRGRRAGQPPKLKFHQKLVLNQWMLSLFEANNFKKFAEALKEERLEGWREDNVSHFHEQLTSRLFDHPLLTNDDLLRYDQNIYHHTQTINRSRKEPIRWKYFQYLSLLFAEIYLDKYFRDPEGMLAGLNAYVQAFNEAHSAEERIDPYVASDLSKLAFWNATGSGKTLLMHVNILQYRHYLKAAGKENTMNRIILLTPNEGLSTQHLLEFHESGMQAEIFSKENKRTLFTGKSIEIIDIHKLADKMGDKTVAIDAFEGDNLVLVDEGHRGSSGKEWMAKRNQLSKNGFSFEYSATFGQAMKASNDKKLEQEYAKCILFDYSYKFFYEDGYGKDYNILNLDDRIDTDDVRRRNYLTACLLTFYQQLRFYGENKATLAAFLIEKPLWIFVGGSVNAVRTENRRSVSDVVDILLFLGEFLKNQKQSIHIIDLLLKGKAGLLVQDKEIFAHSFRYLREAQDSPEAIFRDLMARLFNAEAYGSLHVELLKGSDGEIALRVGEFEPFGVINVGDAPKLADLCEEHTDLLTVTRKPFSGSYFRAINNKDSSIHILIGSKKFTEGWSSWRVSTMGLMNIGKREGSEIIQLFGRGVRLKGYNFGLKRSDHVPGIQKPKFIKQLETLNVFGIRAGYMEQFKQYLEDEGMSPDGQFEEIELPVLSNFNRDKKLKVIRLKDNVVFKKDGPKPTLDKEDYFYSHRISVNWYPKIQASHSKGAAVMAIDVEPEAYRFNAMHLAFLDWDAIYFELQEYKNERAWYNLNLPKSQLRDLLLDDWYNILIPADQMKFLDVERDVRRWQEIAVSLLKKYVDRYYTLQRSRWEQQHLEYKEMEADDPNLLNEEMPYIINVEKTQEELIQKIKALKSAIEEQREFKEMEFAKFFAFGFHRHLYEPLIHIGKGCDYVQVKPVALNDGEREFVEDLRDHYGRNKEFFADKELYLLRNQSKGTGLGFFEEGGFYPDFILWILAAGKQYISFVDPKGLRFGRGLEEDPKINFCLRIKEIEDRLREGDSTIVLNSFIVTSTDFHSIKWWAKNRSLEDFKAGNVFFLKDEKDTYVGQIIHKMLN